MDLFKAQLDRINAHLMGLSASQKMLTASLVAIMVMTIFWWAHYAGQPEMEPLLDQSLTQDDVSQITTRLQAKDIKYTVLGDKILVAADRKFEVLADLSYSHLLPHNFATGFDEIAQKLSPWDSSSHASAMYNHAKEITLMQVLSRFPGVSEAQVMIDPTTERGFGSDAVQPSATINIFTRDDGKTHASQMITAAADLVCGYVAGLTRSRINVILDGVSYPLPDRGDEDSIASGEDVDNIRRHENYYCEKIQNQFRYIAGLSVSVTVSLDNKKVDTKQTVVDPKQSLHLETETDNRTEENSTSGAGGEPGAIPNSAVSLPAPAGGGVGGTTSTVDDEKATFAVIPSVKEQTTHQPAGTATVVAASVQVPRSYFLTAYRNTNGKDPDDSTLARMMDDEKESIRKSVMACCGLEKDDAVVVAVYSDAMPALTSSLPPGGAGPVVSVVSAHSKELGVGALAVVSLFMMLMMVKKGTPAPVIAMPSSAAPDLGRMSSEMDIAGEATEGGTTLDAVELDDDTVKTQQMLEQVQKMVSDNPDAAASLVKRWMNRA